MRLGSIHSSRGRAASRRRSCVTTQKLFPIVMSRKKSLDFELVSHFKRGAKKRVGGGSRAVAELEQSGGVSLELGRAGAGRVQNRSREDPELFSAESYRL